MLNLIKSDLYRITRPRGLRGSFWQYGIAILAAYGLVMALVAFANSAMYQDMTGNTIGDVVTKTSLTVYFADMLNGLVPLCVAFMAVEHSLAEFKNGYIKSVLSARSGRLSYIAGKVLFAGLRDDTYRLYSAMDAFAMPSVYEGLPVAGVEACSAGLRCLYSTNVSRQADLIGTADFLPLGAGPRCWARRLAELRGSASDFAARAQAAAAVKATGYDIRTVAGRLNALYCGEEA